MEISSAISAQISQTRSELATNAVKQAAQQDQKIADVLDDASRNVNANAVRGTNVNITV